MDDFGQKQKKARKARLVAHLNTLNYKLNPWLAAYEILKSFGFDITFDPSSKYRMFEDTVTVFFGRNNRHKLKEVLEKLLLNREFLSFLSAYDGLPSSVLKLVNQTDWPKSDEKLLKQVLKLSYLRAAEIASKRGKKDDAIANQIKAEEIDELPLDPEGMRIVLGEKIRQILEEHPELRPAIQTSKKIRFLLPHCSPNNTPGVFCT